MIILVSRSILPRIRNVSDKSRRENHNTHFMFNNFFFFFRKSYRLWENTVEPGKPQMTIRCMRIACWIRKTINTLSEYVILIACPLQQWLQERTSMVRYTYIACIVTFTPGVSSSKKKNVSTNEEPSQLTSHWCNRATCSIFKSQEW